jgi:hypothetical protein
VRDLEDESLADQSPEIGRRLTGVRLAEQYPDALDQLTIGKPDATWQKPEGPQHRHLANAADDDLELPLPSQECTDLARRLKFRHISPQKIRSMQ